MREYLALVADHAQAELILRKRAARKPLRQFDLLMVRAALWVVGPPVFLYKRWRIGDCRFAIDHEGIVRDSKAGRMAVPWSEVMRIFEYPSGYLIMKSQGGMPIPLRCLSGAQWQQLRTLAADRLQ
ncbi:YcxB family protein [Pseudoduganella sp. UC29_106]|uniref:YcxB family protein n=1 Tax=Pseudoduganella sp. UC29_106 TaxID=3374553 RepID=UPI0037567058